MSERDMRHPERHEEALQMIAELLGCGSGDAVAVLEMLHVHGSEELIDQTREFITDTDTEWSFGAFVSGIERLVLYSLGGKISDDLYDGLSTIAIDDNYVAWGAVASMGDLPLEVAEVFATMCRDGVTDELVKILIETYETLREV